MEFVVRVQFLKGVSVEGERFVGETICEADSFFDDTDDGFLRAVKAFQAGNDAAYEEVE